MKRILVLYVTLPVVASTLQGASLAGDRAKPRSPVAGKIAAYVSQFEETDAGLLRALPKFKETQRKSKERGWKPPWEGYKNVKARTYYEKLPTADLAKECFSTSLWARDMLIYNRPAYGIVRAEVFHDGFSVLCQRPDFWEGIASVYRHLAQELSQIKVERRQKDNPEALSAEERKQMDILFNLQTLQYAYTFPPFRERLKGREKLLMRANLEALRAVLAYTRESGRRGSKSFWGAGVAHGLCCPTLALLRRTNPDQYSEIIGRLEKTELSFTKPDPREVEGYIRLVISSVEQALAEEEAQAEDATGKGQGGARRRTSQPALQLHLPHDTTRELEDRRLIGSCTDNDLLGAMGGLSVLAPGQRQTSCRWHPDRWQGRAQ